MKRVFFILLFLVSAGSGCSSLYSEKAEHSAQPKNIILMIGDGLGTAQLTAAKYIKGDIALEKFTAAGLVTTHAADSLVTDSAAAGTAMATGKKTNNRMISVDPNGEPLKSVFQWAEELGKSTGVVVTSSVTHATPAVFMAHAKDRYRESEIAEQITASGVDVLFGGGRGYFIPASEEGSFRKDEKNLLDRFRGNMAVATTADEFEALGHDTPAVALLSSMHLPGAKNRNPSLAALVLKALAILSKNKNGFVLVIEGSQIDWAGHNRDTNALVEEVVDFDDAIQAAANFAVSNQETLVVATSDHETGGFAIHQGSADERLITETGFTTGSHTATMVPLFAIGPGSAAFNGIHDNAFIGETLIQYVRNTAE